MESLCFIYFVGLLFLAGSIGCLNGSIFGFMTLGIGLLVLALIGIIITYLEEGR